MAASAPSHYRMLTINQKMLSSTFLDQEGRPSFNALQNYGSAPAPAVYYVFDVMVLSGQNMMREPLRKRRDLLEKRFSGGSPNRSGTRRRSTQICASLSNP